MEIGRNRSKKRLGLVLLLTTMTLTAFCMGKAMGHLFWLATLLFLVPHALILTASLMTLNQINKGIE